MKEAAGIHADEALQELIEGNQRYVEEKSAHHGEKMKRRAEVANVQRPFAVIISCSDSRVPPEIIFDQGIGDLFVVRVAGNILNDVVLGSVEYAAAHLRSPLIMLLGHKRCGAVDATLKGGGVRGHIGSLVKAIKPAVIRAKGTPGDLLNNAVIANIELGVQELKSSKPILAGSVKKSILKVVGAYYDLDTGRVDIVVP